MYCLFGGVNLNPYLTYLNEVKKAYIRAGVSLPFNVDISKTTSSDETTANMQLAQAALEGYGFLQDILSECDSAYAINLNGISGSVLYKERLRESFLPEFKARLAAEQEAQLDDLPVKDKYKLQGSQIPILGVFGSIDPSVFLVEEDEGIIDSRDSQTPEQRAQVLDLFMSKLTNSTAVEPVEVVDEDVNLNDEEFEEDDCVDFEELEEEEINEIEDDAWFGEESPITEPLEGLSQLTPNEDAISDIDDSIFDDDFAEPASYNAQYAPIQSENSLDEIEDIEDFEEEDDSDDGWDTDIDEEVAENSDDVFEGDNSDDGWGDDGEDSEDSDDSENNEDSDASINELEEDEFEDYDSWEEEGSQLEESYDDGEDGWDTSSEEDSDGSDEFIDDEDGDGWDSDATDETDTDFVLFSDEDIEDEDDWDNSSEENSDGLDEDIDDEDGWNDSSSEDLEDSEDDISDEYNEDGWDTSSEENSDGSDGDIVYEDDEDGWADSQEDDSSDEDSFPLFDDLSDDEEDWGEMETSSDDIDQVDEDSDEDDDGWGEDLDRAMSDAMDSLMPSAEDDFFVFTEDSIPHDTSQIQPSMGVNSEISAEYTNSQQNFDEVLADALEQGVSKLFAWGKRKLKGSRGDDNSSR